MPNQYTMPGEYVGNRERILKFVRSHPRTTTGEIVKKLGGDTSHTGMHLNRLYNAGLVYRDKEHGVRGFVWTAKEEDQVDAMDKRVVVQKKQWFGCPGRDPLVAALFGPATAQVPPC